MTAAGCRQHCTASKIAMSAEPPHSSDHHQSTSVITYYGHKSITVYSVAILSTTPWGLGRAVWHSEVSGERKSAFSHDC